MRFVNDGSWCIPATKKGELTQAGSGGLPYLPVALVAVKDLKIKAEWSPEDVAAAGMPTGFVPFKVDSTVVNNTLSHKGIQIMGWLLQKMPDLPPNDFPAS
jgi:hypothetical protein